MYILFYKKVKNSYLALDFKDTSLISNPDEFKLGVLLNKTILDYIKSKRPDNQIFIKETAIKKGQITSIDDLVLVPLVQEETTDPLHLSDDEMALKAEKKELLYNLEKRYSEAMTNGIDFMVYIKFLTLFNYFASKGIFITEENKEDKYIEVLELEDESAIDKLEQFIEIQEILEDRLAIIDNLIELKEDIEYAMSEEELEEAKEAYFKPIKLLKDTISIPKPPKKK